MESLVSDLWVKFLAANPLWKAVADEIDALNITGAADYDHLFGLLPMAVLSGF